MKKLFLLLLAILAVRLAGRAARQNVQLMAALWLLVGMSANLNASSDPKTRLVESRLNALVPVVFPNTGGTISGNVNVTGTHNVNSDLTVGGNANGAGGGTLHNSGGFHSSGTVQADSQLVSPNVHATTQMLVNGASTSSALGIAGDTHGSGSGQFDSGVSTSGNVVASGNVNAGSQVLVNGAVSSSALGINGNTHGSGSGQFDAGISAGNFSGSFAGGQGNPGHAVGTPFNATTFSNLASAFNALEDACRDAGVVS
jgi:hypothetical protein